MTDIRTAWQRWWDSLTPEERERRTKRLKRDFEAAIKRETPAQKRERRRQMAANARSISPEAARARALKGAETKRLKRQASTRVDATSGT